jgi:PHD-zinc-finger like domain/PHD-finger
MTCVRPVLTKKPTRGFGWACAPCSRAQERKLEARNTPISGDRGAGSLEDAVEEEEEDHGGAIDGTGKSTPATTGENDQIARPATTEQSTQAKLWPYRYLGIHCQVEDALDYDDRIYPRAASRLGPRHQANVNVWHGRAIQFVKPAEIKRKYAKASTGKKSTALTKETLAALEAEKVARAKRPKWVMDEPPGFVRRGEDHPTESLENTAQLMFKMPDDGQSTSRGGDEYEMEVDPADRERLVDDYMTKAKEVAGQIGVEPYSTNFLDKALEIFCGRKYDVEASLAELRTLSKRKDLREPELSREEVKKFEEGVEKYGSELYSITKHVKTVKHRRIVRFYYMWKKTDRGKQIWGNWHDRKGKKEAKRAVANAAKLVDDVADDNDDSAFDNAKAVEKKRAFECKFCFTRSSRQWRRAPETAPGTMVPPDSYSKNSKDKSSWLTVALCQRCALLWRKYAIIWENMEEVAKKVAQGGGRAWKRRVDAELLQELATATAETRVAVSSSTAATVAAVGIPGSAQLTIQSQEPPKKKVKSGQEKESSTPPVSGPLLDATNKKKAVEKPPEPEETKPDPPRERVFPCAVCNRDETKGEILRCRDCRLTVHRQCYGVSGDRPSQKWICDMCANDRNPQVSTTYECILCPLTDQEVELFEAPKISHKKKSDRERDKEKKEREMVVEAVKLFRQHQHDAGRAENPREPLKKTSGNHWAHITCSVWIPEVKFGDAKTFEPAEGFGLIPPERYLEQCKFCKQKRGPTVSCHFSGCNAQFHVGCAYRELCWMGFDITPVKSSRRDVVNTMKLGEELGSAVAAIWCNTHPVPTGIHEMSERDETGEYNALQLYAQTFKQADLGSTGTVRKASYIQQPAVTVPQNPVAAPNRRGSAINSASTSRPSQSTTRSDRTSPAESVKLEDGSAEVDGVQPANGTSTDEPVKKCLTCSLRVSPKWWPIERKPPQNPASWSENRPPAQGPDNASPTAQRFSESNVTGPLRPLNINSPISPPVAGKGDSLMQDVTPLSERPVMVETDPPEPVQYQCHRCHIKKPSLPTIAAERPTSSYQIPANPRSLQPRPSDYPPPPTIPSHSHPPQPPAGMGRPWAGPSIRPDWKHDSDQRPHDYGHSHLRNGLPPGQPNGLSHAPPLSGYNPGGPPPPQHQHMNGYPSGPPLAHPHAPPLRQHPPQTQYARPPVNGVPPPQFSPRQATFPGRPFSASPPRDPPRIPPHPSPSMSMQGPPRSYPPVGQPPPPLHHGSQRDSQRPATPTQAQTPTADGRPGSSSGWANNNGAGASASPSVRNLLS